MNRREALKAIGTCAASACVSSSGRLLAQQKLAANAPNIVLVMTDDQRHDAVSLAGKG